LGELILVLVIPTKHVLFLRDAGMEFALSINKLGNICFRSAVAAGLAIYE
jgi:hypothetical protein